MPEHRDIFLMEQIYGTLFALTNKLQVKVDASFKYLTSRQLMTLIAIAHLPEGTTTLNNIATKLGTTKQSIRQVVAIVEKKGYAKTVPHPTDKRAVNVIITPAGTDAMISDGEHGMRLFADIYNGFTLDELESLWVMLKRLYCFDGEQHNGFEEEVTIGTDEERGEINERIRKQFSDR